MMARGVASLVIRQCNFKRWQSHLVLLVMFGLTGKIGIAKPVASTRRPCPSSRANRTVFPIISRVRSVLHPSRRTRSSRRRRSRHDQKNLRLLRCPVQSPSRHRQLVRKIAEQPSPEALPPPAQNVIQMQPAPSAHPPRMVPPPESPVSQNPVAESPRLVAVSNLRADFFEKFAQSDGTALSKRRRKAKMRR